MSRELLQLAADTIEAMWDRRAGGKLNIDAASSSFIHRAQLTLAALRAALAQPETQPVNQQIESINAVFDAWRNGEDASMTLGLATPQAQPAPAVQVVLRQPNLFAADPAAPAVNCEWTNCPRRVGDVCCNDRPAAPAVPAVDCRTCARCYATKGRGVYGCDSVVRCTNGDRYQPLPPVKLWRAA